MLKKFRSGCKNLDNQTRSDEAVDSEAMFQIIEAKPASIKRRVSGKLSNSLYRELCHLHEFSKIVRSCQIVPNVNKILQNF